MMQRITIAFCMAAVISVQAQTINLSGNVLDGGGAPISDAIVTLVGQDMSDTTGNDGRYEIKQIEVAVQRALKPDYRNFIVEKGGLVFSLPDPTPLKIELFDVQGILLKRVATSSMPTGFYRFDIAEHVRAARVLIVHVTLGRDVKTFRYLPLNNGNFAVNEFSSEVGSIEGGRLTKIAAINDTLKVTAENFKEKVLPITSYEMEQDITLESNVESADTGRSIGCGKALSDLRTGSYTINSSGENRKYVVVVPDNYNPDKPYKLFFGMHCMNSNMNGVKNDGFYRLQQYDTEKNYIWIAPEGTQTSFSSMCGNCPLWEGPGNNKDHILFDELLSLAKEKLCIDTARVFSVGFSFGAMYSYALSTNHQKQLRAVVTYAPANYNIYLPTNTHEPIAYMQTTGLSDGTCPWDQGGQGGKYCAIGHAEDNGCTDPTNLPTWTSGSYKVHDYPGCDEGYPVKIVTFNGGHTDRESWMPQMTWDFINQF